MLLFFQKCLFGYELIFKSCCAKQGNAAQFRKKALGTQCDFESSAIYLFGTWGKCCPFFKKHLGCNNMTLLFFNFRFRAGDMQHCCPSCSNIFGCALQTCYSKLGEMLPTFLAQLGSNLQVVP